MLLSDYGNARKKQTRTDKIPLYMQLFLLAAILAANYIFKLGLNWVDFTIIGIIFFFAFIGYIKGLIGAVFSLAGYVIAVICAVLFAEPVALLVMEKTKIRETIAKALENAYSGFSIPAFSQSIDFSKFQNGNQLIESNAELQQFFKDNEIFHHLFDNVNPLQSGAQAISNVVTSITDMLVFAVLKVIAIIALFLIVKLIITIVTGIINNIISASNFLSTTNKTIGLVLGTIIGCFVVFVAISYIVPFVGSLNIIKIPEEYINSQVIRWAFAPVPPS
ncbi:MAG: CvpA family protein [Clostridiaceae bacterium]|nr:CvpA family protein [Clostridiaceae bacterium]